MMTVVANKRSGLADDPPAPIGLPPGGGGSMGGSGTSTSGGTTTGGGFVKKKSEAPCPCRWEQVKTVKYLTDEPKPGSVPVMVQTSKWVCDQPSDVETKVLCEETNNALGTNNATDTNNTAITGLYGLGQSLDPNIDYSGNVSINKATENSTSEIPNWGWGLIGLAIGGGIAYVATN
jgi:hypothetical protein